MLGTLEFLKRRSEAQLENSSAFGAGSEPPVYIKGKRNGRRPFSLFRYGRAQSGGNTRNAGLQIPERQTHNWALGLLPGRGPNGSTYVLEQFDGDSASCALIRPYFATLCHNDGPFLQRSIAACDLLVLPTPEKIIGLSLQLEQTLEQLQILQGQGQGQGQGRSHGDISKSMPRKLQRLQGTRLQKLKDKLEARKTRLQEAQLLNWQHFARDAFACFEFIQAKRFPESGKRDIQVYCSEPALVALYRQLQIQNSDPRVEAGGVFLDEFKPCRTGESISNLKELCARFPSLQFQGVRTLRQWSCEDIGEDVARTNQDSIPRSFEWGNWDLALVLDSLSRWGIETYYSKLCAYWSGVQVAFVELDLGRNSLLGQRRRPFGLTIEDRGAQAAADREAIVSGRLGSAESSKTLPIDTERTRFYRGVDYLQRLYRWSQSLSQKTRRNDTSSSVSSAEVCLGNLLCLQPVFSAVRSSYKSRDLPGHLLLCRVGPRQLWHLAVAGRKKGLPDCALEFRLARAQAHPTQAGQGQNWDLGQGLTLRSPAMRGISLQYETGLWQELNAAAVVPLQQIVWQREKRIWQNLRQTAQDLAELVPPQQKSFCLLIEREVSQLLGHLEQFEEKREARNGGKLPEICVQKAWRKGLHSRAATQQPLWRLADCRRFWTEFFQRSKDAKHNQKVGIPAFLLWQLWAQLEPNIAHKLRKNKKISRFLKRVRPQFETLLQYLGIVDLWQLRPQLEYRFAGFLRRPIQGAKAWRQMLSREVIGAAQTRLQRILRFVIPLRINERGAYYLWPDWRSALFSCVAGSSSFPEEELMPQLMEQRGIQKREPQDLLARVHKYLSREAQASARVARLEGQLQDFMQCCAKDARLADKWLESLPLEAPPRPPVSGGWKLRILALCQLMLPIIWVEKLRSVAAHLSNYWPGRLQNTFLLAVGVVSHAGQVSADGIRQCGITVLQFVFGHLWHRAALWLERAEQRRIRRLQGHAARVEAKRLATADKLQRKEVASSARRERRAARQESRAVLRREAMAQRKMRQRLKVEVAAARKAQRTQRLRKRLAVRLQSQRQHLQRQEQRQLQLISWMESLHSFWAPFARAARTWSSFYARHQMSVILAASSAVLMLFVLLFVPRGLYRDAAQTLQNMVVRWSQSPAELEGEKLLSLAPPVAIPDLEALAPAARPSAGAEVNGPEVNRAEGPEQETGDKVRAFKAAAKDQNTQNSTGNNSENRAAREPANDLQTMTKMGSQSNDSANSGGTKGEQALSPARGGPLSLPKPAADNTKSQEKKQTEPQAESKNNKLEKSPESGVPKSKPSAASSSDSPAAANARFDEDSEGMGDKEKDKVSGAVKPTDSARSPLAPLDEGKTQKTPEVSIKQDPAALAEGRQEAGDQQTSAKASGGVAPPIITDQGAAAGPGDKAVVDSEQGAEVEAETATPAKPEPAAGNATTKDSEKDEDGAENLAAEAPGALQAEESNEQARDGTVEDADKNELQKEEQEDQNQSQINDTQETGEETEEEVKSPNIELPTGGTVEADRPTDQAVAPVQTNVEPSAAQ